MREVQSKSAAFFTNIQEHRPRRREQFARRAQ
jgi:hypothetical protein